MGAQQFGLGSGVDKLFRNGTLPLHEDRGDVKTLPLFKLRAGAGQPRQVFDEQALDELAASIKAQGVIQPLLVRAASDGMYEIVAGERRWRAARKAGLSQVPVLIRELTDAEALTVALVENLQREDLNPVEEARAIAALRDRLNLSQEDIAARIGKSRSAVANALRLLQLSEPVLEALHSGTLTPGHARALLALTDEAARAALFAAIQAQGLSVRDAESAVAQYRETGALPAVLVAPASPHIRPRAPRAAKTPEIKAAQLRLRARLHPKAGISGSATKGRVTLPYESAEALAAILAAFDA